MKNKIIFCFFISLVLHSLSFCQIVGIEVFNKTGYNLDSVSFYNIELGNITQDSSVVLADLDEIIFLGDLPLHLPFGLIEGKKRPTNLTPCGTKSKKKNDGFYQFDILIYEIGNEYRLYWRKHE